jgi:hypothetical protein
MHLLSFLLGAALGFSASLFFIVIILRWAWRNRSLLRQIINEIYHIDLLPFICRIEGLLNLALMELKIESAHMQMYLELALKEVKQLKSQVVKAVERYTKYQ